MQAVYGNAVDVIVHQHRVFGYALYLHVHLRTTTVPGRHISGFWKSVCNIAMAAKTADRHSHGFQPNFSNRFVESDCLFLTNSAVTSYVLRSAKKLKRAETREQLRRVGMSIRLISGIVQQLTLLKVAL